MAYSITLRSPNGAEEVIQCEGDQYILEAFHIGLSLIHSK